jgi:hypothetical protein
MVSSTFYDLRQIRADLTNFIIEELAYVPLLSELNSFPVDPDADTVENCRRRVQNDADILVLVIGGRYGYIDTKASKSITNLEYLAARSKGIPIFAFVQKSVLSLVPIWKDNPSMDFSAAVDDSRVFTFIEDVRSTDKVWMFEFENAQTIIDTLRIQFAYLMEEGLHLKLKFKAASPFNIENLSGESIRLALEKPRGWEYMLFAQSLIDQVAAYKDVRRELELGLDLGISEYVSLDNFQQWSSPRLQELSQIVGTLTKLINKSAQDAFGPPGEPGDVEAITFVTRKIGESYRQAVDWALKVRRACVDDALEAVKGALVQFPNDIIEKVESLGPHCLKGFGDALAAPDTGVPRVVEVKIAITLSNADQFSKELSAAVTEIRRRQGL